MKKALAMKWVKALRSGKYKQGTTYLRDKDDNFCCLGVLCEVEKIKAVATTHNCFKYDNNVSRYPGESLVSTLGTIPDSVQTLASLNDIEGLTFDEIADIIQICYKEL